MNAELTAFITGSLTAIDEVAVRRMPIGSRRIAKADQVFLCKRKPLARIFLRERKPRTVVFDLDRPPLTFTSNREALPAKNSRCYSRQARKSTCRNPLRPDVTEIQSGT
ncbi:MAG: hypothetical protein R3F11_28675 [Verrucomicrobiales bacterium]